MKKLSCIFGFIIYLIVGLIVALPVTASAATDVSGIITADTTWTLFDSPYFVSGNVLVNSGVTLTIEPGVIVKFDGNTGLQIEGTLIAIGTDTDNIIFTSGQAAPAAGDWAFIFFSDSSIDAVYDEVGNYTDGSILEYCVVEYAGSSILDGALRMDNAHPFINYCTIMDNSSSIRADNLTGTLKITNSSISNNTGYAIRVDGGTAIIISNNIISNGGGIYNVWGISTISGNTISDNALTGIYVRYGTATISDNTISNNDEDGMYVSSGTITDNIISNNTNYGITVDSATISYNIINYNGSGVKVDSAIVSNNIISNNFRGGGIYIGGTSTISNNTISNNTTTYYGADDGSGIYVSGKGNATISDNIIANNIANGEGGGIYIELYGSTNGSYAGTATITNNYITGNSAKNASAVYYRTEISNKDFSNNVITGNIATGADSTSTVLISGNPLFNNNVITGNIASGAGFTCTVLIGGNPLFNYNDIYNNTTAYELCSNNGLNLDATNNWWGTSVESEIQASIYDWFDDISKGIVDYYPFLDSPNAEPEPYISANPTSWDFGPVFVGDNFPVASFTVSNNGTADLVISGVSLVDADTYSGDQGTLYYGITGDTCSGATVAPAGSCVIDVVFAPTDLYHASVSLLINSNDPDTPVLNIGLSGTGYPPPDISASPTSKDFGAVDVGAGSAVAVFTVSNNGSADLEISEASLAGANPDQFVITGDTCSGAAVAPAESCTIDLVFSPIDAAEMSASLAINSNDPDTPELNIGLSGTGVDIADEYKGKGNGWRNGKN